MNFIPKIVYVELGTGLTKTITFTTAPEGDPYNEVIDGDARTSETSNGNYQTQWNRNTETLNFDFRFETLSNKTLFAVFFNEHAVKGGSFKWFKHSDESDFETYRMISRKMKYLRPMANGTGDFYYNFKFTIKRTIDLEYETEVLGVGAIDETQFDLSDGQSGANIDGLSFDDSLVGAAIVEFYIYRNTTGAGAVERSASGQLRCSRKNTADSWKIDSPANNYVGIDFAMDATGQVIYDSDSLTGTPDKNYIIFRANTLSQGS